MLAFLQTSKPLPDPHTHCTGEKTEAEADVALESLGFLQSRMGCWLSLQSLAPDQIAQGTQ